MDGRYAGVTLTVNEDIGAFEGWMDDGTGIHDIDLAATMRRYAERYACALEEEFPGAVVEVRWTNGGGRTEIRGHMDAANYIGEQELADAQTAAFDALCPDGNPDQIIVWERAPTR